MEPPAILNKPAQQMANKKTFIVQSPPPDAAAGLARPFGFCTLNLTGFSRELRVGVEGLDNPVSPPWHGLAVRLTRRPRQRGQHHAPTGSILGCLDQKFPQRDIDVDIVEFEVEGGPHVGRAYEARRGVMLPSHPPRMDREPTAGFHPVLVKVETAPPSQSPGMPLQTTTF